MTFHYMLAIHHGAIIGTDQVRRIKHFESHTIVNKNILIRNLLNTVTI